MLFPSLLFTALGTNSGSLHKKRHPSAYLLEYGKDAFLLDCGEGTQFRLVQAGKKLSKISAVFITHLHADHYLGLPGLLHSMDMQGRKAPLKIVCPSALKAFIVFQFSLSNDSPCFEMEWIFTDEVGKDSLYPLFTLPFVAVKAFRLEHRVPSCGFLFNFKEEYYKWNHSKMDASWGRKEFQLLSNGGVLEYNGQILKAEDVRVLKSKERNWIYFGDTRFVPFLASQFPSHAIMVHEATYADELEAKAFETGHATSTQAAQMALLSAADFLFLTHFSSRYDNPIDLEAEAQRIFPSTIALVEGKTYEFELIDSTQL